MAEIDDAPQQRQLKIGKAVIGLVGLDVALNRLMQKNPSRETAIDELFRTVAAHNYIPAGMADKYRQALAREYDRLKVGAPTNDNKNTLTIRILGPGCVSCNNLQKLIIEIMNRLRIAADIFQVHDLDEIGRYGVMQTPALIINGRLKSTGRLPTSSQIEEWLRQEIDS
ncbi:thioredoxin family protein [Desulfobacterota bacterium M19]